ncbi:precorrin-3B synthase [Kribbella sp. CA-293567]|uniref:precorrin-3B synthase n=1 Tax=Kribbella sp. CA-293567 TaxID=3002436 RepID=UPI0022DE8191|nr:precorrin-3B synthase [Kribbella sp. CA-293567]WBQ07383.1 precorrin-3B synthase [Kribbella sp. CA-293567]
MHEAADGGLARVRLPGGVLSAEQLRVLIAAAVGLGDGHLELTSRANVQLRALQPGAPIELSDRLYAAGLLPSISHERVRNILASPLAGLDQHSQYDVLPLATELDQLLCAQPALAELPGRFLFALDDGRGDLVTAKADVAVRMVDGSRGELVLAGVGTGVLVEAGRVAGVMVAAAEAFLVERAEQRSEAWRLGELVEGAQRVLGRLGFERVATAGLDAGSSAAGSAVAGVFGERSDVLVAAVPLGVLAAEQAEALAEVAGRGGLRVTPWRSVVVGGVADAERAVRRLMATGLVLEASSPWNGVTSCAGRPGCAKSLADVRGDARRVVPAWTAGRRVVHWSGCERRCGRPGGKFVDVVALAGGGYSVDGVAMTVDEVRA